jgi:hypothetical protein
VDRVSSIKIRNADTNGKRDFRDFRVCMEKP